MRADVGATAVFGVVSVAAAVWSGAVGVALAVDGVLFVVGCVVFAWAFLRGVGRSRDEVISLGGLFFLTGVGVPVSVARWLWGALAVQVVVAVATAAVRPFSSLAFGVLAPMFGMAMLALWGAVHGRFPPRESQREPQRRQRSPKQQQIPKQQQTPRGERAGARETAQARPKQKGRGQRDTQRARRPRRPQ